MTSCEKIQFQLKYMYTTKTGTPMKTGLSTIHGVRAQKAVPKISKQIYDN